MNDTFDYKVLWCDRNFKSLGETNFLPEINDIQFVYLHDVDEAIKEFERRRDYSLIISGNKFDNGRTGLHFFDSLNISGGNTQFLLLTGEIYEDFSSYSLLRNFTYLSKYEVEPLKLRTLVVELVNRSTKTDDLNLRLKALRSHLNISEIDFALMIGSTQDKVISFENQNDVPSFYIVSVCNKFQLPISYFTSKTLDVFLSRIREIVIPRLQKKSN